ncbi:MAG: response regulator [Bacteroides sp.]|nr:response regulator [Eubacterium sp.]MCM1419273.1 response regulator [Roseburia sp.]MCM1463135.1 response regulator [Bacteroides sp.]
MAQTKKIKIRKRKSVPFLLRVIAPMIMLSVLQIVLIVSIMTVNGEFSMIHKFSYDSLTEKTEYRGNYVENVLNQKTALVYETAKAVNAATERILEEEGVSASAIAEDKRLGKRIVAENTESLISLIRRDMVNDAFIVLDSGALYDSGETKNLLGVYLRDNDVSGYGTETNSDIFLEAGSSEIARAFGMPLDYGWTLYFGGADRDNERYRFYFETLDGGRAHSALDDSRLGRWTPLASVAESTDESLKYTLPLTTSDGTVYGVIGIGLLQKTVLQSIPATDFFDNSACYVLAADLDKSGEYTILLSSGPMFGQLVDEHTVLSRERPLDYGMYDFTSDGVACIGSIRPLGLYASDSPFREESWVLISVADEAKTLGIHNMLIRVFIITLAISLAAGIIFALLVGKSVSAPVTEMMRDVELSRRNNSLVEFASTGIAEIDNLGVSIAELQSDSLAYGSRVSRLIMMAGGKIGVFFCDVRNGSVFMSESLIRLLNFDSLPEGDATIPFDEFRRRIASIDEEGRLFKLSLFAEFERLLGGEAVEEDETPAVGESLAGGESLELLCEGGEEDAPRWLEFRVNRDGKNLVGLARDITDTVTEKQMIARVKDSEYTEKLIKANAALRDAYMVAKRANHAKTDFLSRMSHDIRTPMNAIIGMTAIAEMHLDDPARAADCLGKIEASSRYLLSLINEILDMSKIESGKFVLNDEEFRIPELIDNIVEMIRPGLKDKDHELKVDAAGIEHEAVIGDSVRIQQAFVNILSNAVKYTSRGGKIELLISEKPITAKEVGCYEFVFRDNGIGMTKEFLERLYEPFERATDVRVNKEQGTGLGMAITKNIVEMMDGDIRVESEPGKGTTFTVTIFLKLREETAIQAANLEGKRVLTADSDHLFAEKVSAILTEYKMRCDWVLSGKEALERIESAVAEGDPYTFVIVDRRLPDMRGVALTTLIRDTIKKEKPTILCAASDWSDIEEQARSAGVAAFIGKPLFRSRLLAAIRSVAKEEQHMGKSLDALSKSDFSGDRALLVDDNELNLEIASEILQMTGLEIETAADGREAFERFSASPEGYYHMIFMDIQMPVMNGYEATAAIRALERSDARTIPIVAMTANAFAEDVRAAKEAGMNEHIAKPLNFARLMEVLNQWLG